jgi:tol-pal system protein YbgF
MIPAATPARAARQETIPTAMTLRTLSRAFLVPLVLAGLAAAFGPATAQIYNRPAGDDFETVGGGAPERDSAGVGMRVDRLEREMRKMTGRIEELQHQVQMLEEQLRARAESAAPSAPAIAERRTPVGAGGGRTPAGDAFDPAANPNAAGAPRQLGQAAASTPLPPPAPRTGTAREAGAPLDLTPPGATGAIAPSPAAAPPQNTAKDDYEAAVGLMRGEQYEAAERSLTVFLSKFPKSKFAPAATYGLGESFYLRSRYREAAEKYLEVKVKYAQSAQAPMALLRLGQSLAQIGAREQACAAFSEIGVTYPGSEAKVRDSALRESKKLQC